LLRVLNAITTRHRILSKKIRCALLLPNC